MLTTDRGASRGLFGLNDAAINYSASTIYMAFQCSLRGLSYLAMPLYPVIRTYLTHVGVITNM